MAHEKAARVAELLLKGLKDGSIKEFMIGWTRKRGITKLTPELKKQLAKDTTDFILKERRDAR